MLFQRVPCFAGFVDAALRQVDISPTGKPVFKIPHALAVTDENQCCHLIRFLLFNFPGILGHRLTIPAPGRGG